MKLRRVYVANVSADTFRSKDTNRCAPFNNLPPELIAEILSHAITACWKTDDYEWIRYSQVCRYWRYSTFEFPSLWSNISTANAQLMQLLFERSQGSHICLRIIVPPLPQRPIKRRFYSSLKENILRATEISCFFPNHPSAAELLVHFRDWDVPNLRHLRFIVNGVPNSYPDEYVSRKLLPSMFVDGYPRLKSIDIQFFVVIGHPFVNLTSICLEGNGTRASYTLSQIIDLLDLNPALEFLSIHRLHLQDDLAYDLPKRVVNLKQLRALYITGHHEHIDCLTSHIIFPLTISILLNYEMDYDHDSWFPESLGDIPRSWVSMPQLFLRRWDKQVTICAVNGDGQTITVRRNMSPPTLVAFLESVSPFPVDSVRELWIDGNWFIGNSGTSWRKAPLQAPWTEFFSGFPALESLRLKCKNDYVDIFSALGDEACPNLTTLELVWDVFSLRYGHKVVISTLKLIREREDKETRIRNLMIADQRSDDGCRDNHRSFDDLQNVEDIEFVLLPQATEFGFRIATQDSDNEEHRHFRRIVCGWDLL